MYEEKPLETIAGHTSQKIILLIDDDEDEHEIFLSALKNIDGSFDFISADSCEEALNRVCCLKQNADLTWVSKQSCFFKCKVI
jgi:hypothetical protein